MNHMLHNAAACQIRLDIPGRAYNWRKLAAGNQSRSVRYLKRRISTPLYRQLVADAKAASAEAKDVEARFGRALGASQESSAAGSNPAHRRFGSATSRTRTHDANRRGHQPGRATSQDPCSRPLDVRGVRM
jgi:uncharacterized protein YfaA (DUF2138 family)